MKGLIAVKGEPSSFTVYSKLHPLAEERAGRALKTVALGSSALARILSSSDEFKVTIEGRGFTFSMTCRGLHCVGVGVFEEGSRGPGSGEMGDPEGLRSSGMHLAQLH